MNVNGFRLRPEHQKALDIEYHRHAARGYDDAVTRHFHFYHVHSLHGWARKLVRSRPGATALDLGTGTGVVATTMASFGCQVTAVDHSLDMLARATATAKSIGVADRIRFELGDCEKLNYRDSSFDAVTIQGVLHHLTDIMPTLREAMRVLKDGGELYISEPCLETTWVGRLSHSILKPVRWVRNKIKGAAPEPDVSDHEAPISGPALVRSVQSLGFRTEQEYLVQFGAVRFLPERLRILPILLLSAPTRRKYGDLVFITARKIVNLVEPAPVPATAVPSETGSARVEARRDHAAT
ncbi:MAG: methyltransferase domain-containing protein [Burkholderiales bacterium]|nr:methyltransferase domain-containing protein [Phycisphaerae bacterium]